MNIPSYLRYAPAKSLTLEQHHYSNGRLAIRAIDCDTGEPIATLTVNVPEIELAEDEVLIKDYAENEGALESLLQANLVLALEVVPCGWTEVVKCRLIKDLS